MSARVFGWLSRRNADRQRQREAAEEYTARQRIRRELLADPNLTPLERLMKWWETSADAGVSDGELDQLEQRHALRLPGDFRGYLKVAMPAGNEYDDEGTRWWPLADIKTVRDECPDWQPQDGDTAQLIFADVLIWCYAWAVDCSEGPDRGKVILISGAHHHPVANDFDSFLDRYLREDNALHK